MPVSSLSHLLQGNGAAEPGLQASTQDRGHSVPGDGFSYRQAPAHAQATPATASPVTPASLNPATGASAGEAYLRRGIPAPTPTDQSHQMTSSLYQCADCKKRYSRPEHLARHIQTHTLGKRFFCQVCGKAFARADLLKRHAGNHDSERDGTKKRRRIDASPGSGRVSHACRPCAAARVKCEEIKPCQRCQKKSLNCEYATTEAGSTAAMHLLHLSADAHSNAHTPSPSSHSSQLSPITAQDQKQMPYGAGLSTIHETRDITSNMDIKPEHGQLQMTNVVVEQGPYAYENAYPTNNTANMTHQPFSDFLRDVLYTQSLDPSRLVEAQGLAVLDFCDDANYELNEMDFGMLDHWNIDGMGERPVVTQAATPQTDDSSVDMAQMRQKLVKIWMESPWRWVPDKRDHGYNEYDLPLPCRDSASQHFQRQVGRVVKDKLDPSTRDKVLAVVLGTCKGDSIRLQVAASFPSPEIIDALTHIFLASHQCSVSSWIHFGTLALNSQCPEWLVTAAAAGATMTPVLTLRKFGFAIQEAVRLALPSRFEENNTGISNLGLVQTLVLGQDIGLWSGNRRKMEIAECHLLIPITMMRYRGRFQRSSYAMSTVSESDQGEALEEKWKRWYEAESWKRLAFHCYMRDSQASMTTLASPTMSYAELTLPLPESKELWFAKTALEWKEEYLKRFASQAKRPPCLGDLLRDIHLLSANRDRLDIQFAISIYLHAFWNLIFEWRQLSAVHRSSPFHNYQGSGPNLILNSRHQELCKALSSFQLVIADWQASISAQEALLLNLVLMNLHVSLDDLQLFAGKEGEDQARRVYPVLQQWAESTEAWQALWHAGQILRQAKMFPPGHLKQFYAVGVHHAALALWTYGVVTKVTRNQSSIPISQNAVYIDDPESTEVQRFIEFGQGRPTIRHPRCDNGRIVESALEDPRSCMDIAQEILRMNFNEGQEPPPPMVENLCLLIKQLGWAACAVGLS
ncbi:putative C6 and C2H2 transcription factor -like protein [Rosellinia necatrix]|uniref:Putative C6 and C2H2 transcription factor-like protein n=1 Tax=Rosellinia necatrix TaxID=77044 RepID=A0A1S7UJN8_ROSNE|nr:putative C6 and C2H2 transcription factor -like protein [Rosellinia necatrix]